MNFTTLSRVTSCKLRLNWHSTPNQRPPEVHRSGYPLIPQRVRGGSLALPGSLQTPYVLACISNTFFPLVITNSLFLFELVLNQRLRSSHSGCCDLQTIICNPSLDINSTVAVNRKTYSTSHICEPTTTKSTPNEPVRSTSRRNAYIIYCISNKNILLDGV